MKINQSANGKTRSAKIREGDRLKDLGLDDVPNEPPEDSERKISSKQKIIKSLDIIEGFSRKV
jgi:hypothetical protein